MKNYQCMTKAELIAALQEFEAQIQFAVQSPESVAAERDRLLHELQAYRDKLEAQNRELHDAQRMLQESRDRYADLYDYAPVGYITLDAEGYIQEVNLTAAIMLRLERSRLTGIPFSRFVAESDVEAFRGHLRQSERTLAPVTIELRIAAIDGKEILARLVSLVVLDSEGHVTQYRITVTDVTRRRQAEETLRRQNAYLTALQDTTFDLVSERDLDRLLENIVTRAGTLLGTTSGFLDLLEAGKDALTPKIGLGGMADSLHFPVRPGEGVAGVVWQTRQPLVVDDYGSWPGRIQGLGPTQIGAIVAVPLLSGDHLLGVLGLGHERTSGRSFGPEEIGVLSQFARFATIAIDNAQLYTTAQQELIERKRAEEEIRHSQVSLKALFESARDVLIFSLDRDHRYTAFNENYRTEIQRLYKVDIAVGMSILDVIKAPGVRALVQASMDRVLAGEPLWEIQEQPGMGVFYELNWNPIRSADGQVIGLSCFARDISERRQSEDALRKLWRTVEQSPASIVITDTAGRIEYVNPKFTQITGYSLDEAVGKNPRILKAGLTPPEEYARLWKTITSGDEWHGEFCNRKKNGELFWEAASISPVVDEAGTITHFVAVKEDITQRKRVEADLDRERNRAQQYLSIAGVMIVTLDPEGRVTLINRKGCQILGYEAAEIIGRNWMDHFIPERLKDEMRGLFDKIIQGPNGEAEEHENPVLTRDGREHIIAWHDVRVSDEYGCVIGVLSSGEDVTERRQAEEALRQSRERARFLADVLDHSAQPFLLAYPDGRLELANAALCELLGYSEEELCAMGWKPLLLSENIQEALAKLHRTGRAHRYHTDCFRKDGTRLPVEILVHLVDGPERDKLYYYAFVTDISERVRAEQRLNEEIARTAALVRTAARLNAQLDLDGVLQAVCEETMRALNVPIALVTLYDAERDVLWLAAVQGAPPDWVKEASALPQAFYEKNQGQFDTLSVIPDLQAVPNLTGAEFFARNDLRTNANAKMCRNGALIGSVSVITRGQTRDFAEKELMLLQGLADQAAQAITNAQLYRELQEHAEHLEQRVQDRTAQLRAQYARSEAILQSTSDGIVVTNASGVILQANPVASQLLHGLVPENTTRLLEVLRELAADAPSRPSRVLELPNLDLELHAAPLLGPQMEKMVLIAIHDVSHLKALDRMKSRFVSNVSHELRTPITTIKLYASLLRKGPVEKRDQFVTALEREADRQVNLIEDILQISRIESGRLDLKCSTCALNELAEQSVNSRRVLAQDRSVALEFRPLESGPIVWVDRGRMMEVIDNLVENAVWYTPRGGRVTIITGLAKANDDIWATLSVKDTGIGIPPEEMQHVFERFYRGEMPRELQIPGTGLGLAIVKEIVELHGGHVTVESRIRVGSTFTVWLPLP